MEQREIKLKNTEIEIKGGLIALFLIISTIILSGISEYINATYIPSVQPVIWAIIWVFICLFIYFSELKFKTHCFLETILVEPMVWWVAVYLIFACLSICLHGVNAYSVEESLRRFSSMGLLLTAIISLHSYRIKALLLCASFHAGWILALTVILSFLRIFFINSQHCQAAGLYLNPNAAACALSCLLLVNSSSSNRKISFSWYEILLITALLLTMSRSGILIGLTCVFLILYQYHLNVTRFAIRVVLSVTTVLFILCISSPWNSEAYICAKNAFKNRLEFLTIIPSPENDMRDKTSAGLRIDLAKKALSSFASNPIFGSGFDESLKSGRSHNFLLELISQHGIFGFFLFISFFYILGKRIGFLWVLPIFFIGFFDHAPLYNRTILFSLALLYSMRRVVTNLPGDGCIQARLTRNRVM